MPFHSMTLRQTGRYGISYTIVKPESVKCQMIANAPISGQTSA